MTRDHDPPAELERCGDDGRPMLTIRPATWGDHRELEALLARASLATGENADELLANPDALAIPPEAIQHSLVAEQGEDIVGFCTILPASDENAEIDAIFIEPAAWRRGLGQQLLAAAERQAAATGVSVMSVVSGRYAEPFYVAQGFRRLDVQMTRFGPAVRLEKRLNTDPPPDGAAGTGGAA